MGETEHNSKSRRITLDKQFSLLSDTTRRRILTELADHNPRNEQEFEATDFKPDDVETELFKSDVYHKHLPKLAEAGFINWDRESGTITRGPNFEQIRPLITLIHEHQDELPTDWP